MSDPLTTPDGELTIPLTRPVEYDKLHKDARSRSLDEYLRSPGYIPLAKYDGVCGIAVLRPGRAPVMLSRTGEDYSMSCAFVLGHLQAAACVAALHRRPLVVMGEVWRPGAAQKDISGDFRQRRLGVPTFEFRMFDAIQVGLDPQPYHERLEVYRELSAADQYRMLHHAQLVTPRQDETAIELSRRMGPGFDGIVLWDLNGLPLANEKARAGQAIKVKPEFTADVRVTGRIEGAGKHAGRMGALTFTYNGKQGSVGTGFSDAERVKFWEYDALFLHTLVIEVEAMGLTPDGNLREPRFKGIRFDKKESD